ncbi:hypothetical protein EV426DRAFT_706071 [Tirmania nivea]|nr:hypothetical protein EV426DRAFT_706071 [Tirmania nivea]
MAKARGCGVGDSGGQRRWRKRSQSRGGSHLGVPRDGDGRGNTWRGNGMAGRNMIVALDSQGAIGRLVNLQFDQTRSWIEARARKLMTEEGRIMMWMKGHSGVEGNEGVDRKAKETTWVGRSMLKLDIATPAGIKQVFLWKAMHPNCYPIYKSASSTPPQALYKPRHKRASKILARARAGE